MKNRQSFKVVCILTALLLLLSAGMLSGFAAEEKPLEATVSQLIDVAAKDNDNIYASDGYDHGYAPNISVFRNKDCSYAVCVNQTDGTLKIIETDGTQVTNEITVTKELTEYGAFTKGTDGTYYVLYGAEIADKDGSKTALRLVNYGADGEKIRSLDMTGNSSGHFEGIAAIDCGNNVLSENGNFITGHIGRLMFTANLEGLVHQASYAFAVNTKTFKQVTVPNSTVIPYASHSFHQFILQDGTDFVYVDRSDAEPHRSFHITKMSGGNSWSLLQKGDSYFFKGEYGYNDTFSQLGGIVKTSAGYLLVSSYQNTTDSTEISAANLVTQLFNPSTLASQPEKVLTSYTGIKAEGITNPKAVLLNKNKVAVPYMVSNQFNETKRMYVAFLDAEGNLTDNKAVKSNAVLPRFGQVMYNSVTNSIEWFSISGGKLIMYSIDLSETYTPETTTAPPAVTEPTTDNEPTETTTSVDNPTNTPQETSTAPTTTQPETEPPTQEPAELNFWQKIVNFFMGIYNWFISLFM
ncbi:MAG: hypothetical protein IKL41_05330 [Clostridia bacterium]|nr:hypothetical protein [Clostridia bacterium]